MKKIRIKICDHDTTEETSYGNTLLALLKKHYEVEHSENPDYVFYNESTFEYLKYDCIRIFFTGENITPNFNLCDYAFGFDYLEFGDRYYRLPFYLVTLFHRPGELNQSRGLDFAEQLLITRDDLAKKTDFCSFVYSNYLGDGMREKMFHLLSEYKQVNAGGKYLNNVGGRVPNKLEFEMKHKFSIAFENSSRSGYTTEKLPTALLAKTIPIYWGNPDIEKEFNPERFINCHAYPTLEAAVEKIKEIDKSDELYLKMINAPVAAPLAFGHYDFKAVQDGFEKFICHIIDQPLENAGRRNINPVRAKELEENERITAGYRKRKGLVQKSLAVAYRPFKKIKVLEGIKQKYLRKWKTR